MTVTTKTEREEYTVTINAPTAFLTSAETVYPVTVDPTFYINETYESGLDDFGNAQYSAAIEDLCIYTGGNDPVYNGLSSVGNYFYEMDTVFSSRMLYRITSGAEISHGLSYYLDDSRFFSAKLYVRGYNVENDVTVIASPFGYIDWNDSMSDCVDEETYYSNMSSYQSTTIVSGNMSQSIGFDITAPLEYYSQYPTVLDEFTMCLMVDGEGNDYDDMCYDQIKLYQTEHSQYNVYIAIDYNSFEGSYYINSESTGKFLTEYRSAVQQEVYNTSMSQSWKFTYMGDNKYTISLPLQPNRVLVMDDDFNVFVGTKTNYDVDNYTWQFTFQANYASLYNVGACEYLYPSSNGSISSTMEPVGAEWRFCKTSAFVPLTEITFGDIVMDVDETVTPAINIKTPTNATWANFSDFSWSSSNNSVATVSSSGVITPAGTGGTTTITAVHKSTGTPKTFNVTVRILPDGIYHIKEDTDEEKYMYLVSNTLIEANEPSDFDDGNAGRFLWGFFMLEDGLYKITSLSEKSTVSNSDNMALTYNDGSLSVSEYSNSNNQKWIISSQNNTYTLAPLSSSISNISIDENNCTNFMIYLSASYTDHGVFSGTYIGHTVGETLNIVVEVDEDVIDDYFENTSNAKQLFGAAIKKWNGKCQNVCVYFDDENVPANAYTVKIQIDSYHTNQDGGEDYGLTQGYKGTDPRTYAQNWNNCVITLYTKYTDSLDNSDKQNVLTHEMGHALKLAHPFSSNASRMVLSIMNNFNQSRLYYLTSEPSARDIYYLNEKWN